MLNELLQLQFSDAIRTACHVTYTAFLGRCAGAAVEWFLNLCVTRSNPCGGTSSMRNNLEWAQAIHSHLFIQAN